ncbi:MAG: DeoR/GlpR transcriptional regulator [Clostridia bacterium]|nr:DeoR/GlpR transcriptional regulator [Clostridia bacterium]
MFMEERHQEILRILSDKGRISNSEIQEVFGISYDSAKRDLRLLEEQGLLKRTHGGAIPARQIGSNVIKNLSPDERVAEVKENYLAIAKEAVKDIEENDVVYITNASVGYLMAQNISDVNCTVVTNSISIAEELRKKENITVILAGGEMQNNGCFYDSFALSLINRLRFDKCFITSACVSKKFGLSIQKSRSVELTNAIINNSKTVYGLYPVEKIGFDSVISICPINKLNYIITDSEVSEDDLTPFEESGIKIKIAD